MNLEDFYDRRKVPDKDRVRGAKDIVLVVADAETDPSWFFEQVGIDCHEAAVTWPKDSVRLVEEVSAIRPKVVVQLGERFSRRYPFVPDQTVSDELRGRVKEAVADRFVVLHHHDEYSLKDGLGTVEQLVKMLGKQRRSFCAVTNHGSVGGWIKQYNACMKAGIKPIFGCEMYVSDYRGDDPELKKAHRSANHLVLLARNETGFYNIIQIHNDAQLNGFYYSPRMNHEAARKWGEGIIATSACMAGEIPRLLMAEPLPREEGEAESDYEARCADARAESRAEAKRIYEHYRNSFDEFYIEIQIIEFELQRECNRRLIGFAREVGAPLMLACDCLHPDTRVVLDDGSVLPIGKLKPGCRVATDDGRSSVVEAVGRRPLRDGEKVYRVTSGTKYQSIVATGDHPFLVSNDGAREWIRASELEKGDWLVVPRPELSCDIEHLETRRWFEGRSKCSLCDGVWRSTRTDKECFVPEYLVLDEECCWVLGMYVAEGYRDGYNIGFGLNDNEIEYKNRIVRFFERFGFNPNDADQKGNGCQVRVTSFGFAPMFEALCGKGSDGKRLPSFWKGLDKARLSALIDGVMCGDGSWNGRRLTLTTTSEQLVNQVQQACLALGLWGGICEVASRFDARTGNTSKPQWGISIGGPQTKGLDWSSIGSQIERRDAWFHRVEEDAILVRVKEVDEVGADEVPEVFDIQVSGRHCFVAEGRIVHNSHYLDPTHADTHDLLMYIRQGKTKLDAVEKDEDVWDFEVRNLFYRSASQMEFVFRKGFVDKSKNECPPFEDEVFTEGVFREAMGNTLAAARKIEDIKLDKTVKLPRLYDDSKGILREKVNAGFRRLGLNRRPDKAVYVERLRHEFDVITQLGWADYFLIMEKIVSMAKEEFFDEVGEWAIGYGRGSAAGCLISWCLGLTDCDPIEHGLLFERFLDEGRPDPPDIDTDFHPGIRQRVKDRIVEMFGEEKTCSIGTYSSYKTRAAIVSVAKALGYDVMEAQEVTKEMDPLKSFETDDGDEVVDKMEFDELVNHYPLLKEYFKKYPEVQVHASVIRNQVQHMGKHAGGVIISDMDLNGKIPVQYDSGGNIISSWAESGSSAELSEVGLVKYDILGLNNLPIIADCVQLVKENKGVELKREDIPLDHRQTIRLEAKGDLRGIFQFENPATKPIVDAVGVESLNDVSAVTSLLRPGPKDMGMHMEYAERKSGKSYQVLPCLEWIFKDTYGILVYQEQMMQISQVLCGFDGPMSNRLRKACGKKLKELMVSIRAKFIDGAQPRIDAGEATLEEVEDLWDLIVSFAKYGFNKSHAVTYSMITTCELWLKHNYFLEYMTALVLNTKRGKERHGSDDILVDYLNYARKKGVEVLPPYVNAVKPDFHIEGGSSMRFGLAHVKNVASAAENIAAIAAASPFRSVTDFHERCVYETEIKSGANAGKKRQTRPNNKVVDSLIHAGAFDCFGDRNIVMEEYGIARLGIPCPTDEEARLERDSVLPAGTRCPGINEPGADLSVIKGVRAVAAHIAAIAAAKPFASMADFHERCVYETEVKSGKSVGTIKESRPTKRVVESLIYAGAFSEFGDVRQMMMEYHLAKNKMKPVRMSEQEMEEREVEMIGMCLSKEPVCRLYADLIRKMRWTPLGSHGNSRKPTVFGRVMSIEPRTSKAGNPMYIVRMSDGLDKLDFFVFKAGMEYFRDSVKNGQLAAVPLDRFEDSLTRFFDDRREVIVVKEN